MRTQANDLRSRGRRAGFTGPRSLFAATFVFLLAIGCGDDKSTSPEPDPDPDPVERYEVIDTWMGTGINGLGIDGPIRTVDLSIPQDVTFGPDGRAYVVDWNNHRIRVVEDGVSETLIGTGEIGDALDGPALSTKLNHPTHVSFDPDGNLILSAWHNSKVMKMDLATGMIVRIAGDGRRSFGGDGGPALAAILDLPSCSVFDPDGNLWITDLANQCVRMIDRNGIITTIVGNHEPGFSGDGGPALNAQIFMPVGQSAPPVGRACFDPAGNYYLADTYNNVIRMVDRSGIIRTVAGTPGSRGFGGDGGPATQALLARPSDVAIGPDGNLYIADTLNSAIRKVDLATGIITTFVGRPNEAPGFGGDGGHPLEAKLDRPFGIEFDAVGNLYIVDTYNHRIRVVWRY